MRFDKLVRDKIPDIIKKNDGRDPITHIAKKEEYWEKLKEKLFEELNEFSISETKEELADILEVIQTIAEFKGYSLSEIEEIRKKKNEERGGFKNKIILE